MLEIKTQTMSSTFHTEKPVLPPFPHPAKVTITHTIGSETNSGALYTSLF